MGWIDATKQLPPKGLSVFLEVSGYYSGGWGVVADHDFYIGSYNVPKGETEGQWLIYDATEIDHGHIYQPTVHAWMPLPKHYAPKEKGFSQNPDLMEHAFFEDDPDYLYKGEYVYEQMTLEEFLKGGD